MTETIETETEFSNVNENSDRFTSYLQSHFKDFDTFFKQWDFDKIESNYENWRVSNHWLRIYLLANDCKSFATQTHIGCAHEVFKRVEQHNGLRPGGPSETKRAEVINIYFFFKILNLFRVIGN